MTKNPQFPSLLHSTLFAPSACLTSWRIGASPTKTKPVNDLQCAKPPRHLARWRSRLTHKQGKDKQKAPWGQGRSWSNNPGYAAGGANGNGWVDTRTPHLIRADGTDDNTIIAVGDGNTAFYFDLVNGAYQPRGYDQSRLVHNVGAHRKIGVTSF
jgi:hypothetical protein